jgi:hypothetical protein
MGVMKVSIPPEATEYKEKFILGMTVRQLAFTVCGLAIAIPTGIFGSKFLPEDVVMWLVTIEAAPFAAFGFFQYNGMPLEKIVGKVFDYYVRNQKNKFIYLPPVYELNTEFSELMIKSDHLIDELERKNEKRRERQAKRGKFQDVTPEFLLQQEFTDLMLKSEYHLDEFELMDEELDRKIAKRQKRKKGDTDNANN